MVKHLMETESASLGESSTNRLQCFSIKFMDKEFDEERKLVVVVDVTTLY
jgi:hypothetical protein